MRYLKLLRMYVRLGILNELEYRANFFLQLMQTLLSLLVSLGGIGVIYTHTELLNGWSSSELLAVVGVYFIFGGYINLIIQPSMVLFLEDVRMGTLDFVLVKPADAQLLISMRQVFIWKIMDMLVGAGVLAAALVQAGLNTSPAQALAFGVALLSGAAIVYSFWLFLATFAFWFVRIDNIFVIFESMYEAGRYPVGIYPAWLRFMLTFLIPIAFTVTVPAEVLVGRLNPGDLGLSALLAVALLGLSRAFWRYGVRSYTGASA